MGKYDDFNLNINKIKVNNGKASTRSTPIISEVASEVVTDIVFHSEQESCAACDTKPSDTCYHSNDTYCECF